MSRRNKILQRMKELHISTYDIAQYVMLSDKTIQLWVDGKITIPFKYMVKICDLLDLEADDLVGVV